MKNTRHSEVKYILTVLLNKYLTPQHFTPTEKSMVLQTEKAYIKTTRIFSIKELFIRHLCFHNSKSKVLPSRFEAFTTENLIRKAGFLEG